MELGALVPPDCGKTVSPPPSTSERYHSTVAIRFFLPLSIILSVFFVVVVVVVVVVAAGVAMLAVAGVAMVAVVAAVAVSAAVAVVIAVRVPCPWRTGVGQSNRGVRRTFASRHT